MTVREVPFNRPDRIVFELFFLLTTFSAGSRRGDKAAGGIVGINSPRGRVVASDPLPFHSGDRKTRERCCVARKRDPWCYRGPEQPANRDLCAIPTPRKAERALMNPMHSPCNLDVPWMHPRCARRDFIVEIRVAEPEKRDGYLRGRGGGWFFCNVNWRRA